MTNTDNIRVIIIEDDPFIAADIEAIIEDSGGVVLDIIPTLKGALHAAETAQADLFTLDFEIINGTTENVASALSKRDIPFIAISGRHEKLKQMTEFNGRVILPKPLNAERLTEALKLHFRTKQH